MTPIVDRGTWRLIGVESVLIGLMFGAFALHERFPNTLTLFLEAVLVLAALIVVAGTAFRILVGRRSPPFAPGDIPDLELRLEPLLGVHTDIDGVFQWDDQSNSRHLKQTTGAKKPVLVVDHAPEENE